MATPYDWSPESVQSSRRYGTGLMQSGADYSPVNHWAQGLARALQGGIGGYMVGQANEGERAGKEGVANTFKEGIANGLPMKQLAASLMGNPWGAEQGQQMATRAMETEQSQGFQREQQDRGFKQQMTMQGAGQAHAERMARLQNDLSVSAPTAQIEKRKEVAQSYGLQPGTEQYNQYVLGGQYSGPADPYKVLKEGETIVSMPRQAGQKPTVLFPENNGPGGSKKFDEEAAKSFVKRYADNMDQGLQAQTQGADIERLKELSSSIGTQGAAATIAQALGPYANALGVKLDGLNEIQAFTAIVSKLAPAMRPPGSGATSDFEFKQYLASLPQLAQTVEGRAQILDQMQAMNQYKIALGDISERVLNRKIDRVQAEQEIKALGNPLASWRQTNPNALPPSQAAAPTGQAPAARLGGQVMEQMRPMIDAVRGELQSGRYDAATAAARIKQALPPDVAAQVLQQLGIRDPAPTSRGTLKNRGTMPNE